jgi:hypothetical protein
MKKVLLTIAAIAVFMNVNAQDKAFQKGNVCVGLGIGLGIYGTQIHSEATYGGVTVEDDTTDGAIAAIFPLTVEYGVTNWLGIGGRFAYSNYFTEKDSITGYKQKTTGMDADLMLNFHLIKSRRFDMPIVVTVGYSNLKIQSNDPWNSMAKDDGLNFGLALNPRIYFGDHIGMFFNVGYAGFNYNSLQYSNDLDSNLNDTNNYKLQLKGNGANLGLGLIVKF